MPNWIDFEKLAALIMQELTSNSEVKWNDSILGRETEVYRQIDVSIRTKYTDDETLVIVQARDRNRPADVNSIGEFASVVKDVGATKGIFICKGGFTSTARIYASNIGIDLLSIHDANSRNWKLDISIPIIWIEETPIVQFGLKVEVLHPTSFCRDERGCFLLSENRDEKVIDILFSIEEMWNKNEISRELDVTHRIKGPEKLYALAIIKGEKKWIPVSDFYVEYEVDQKSWIGYFDPTECRGVLDHLNDEAFTISHLPSNQIPEKIESHWRPIEDPLEVVVSTKGTIVVKTGVSIKTGEGPCSMNLTKL